MPPAPPHREENRRRDGRHRHFAFKADFRSLQPYFQLIVRGQMSRTVAITEDIRVDRAQAFVKKSAMSILIGAQVRQAGTLLSHAEAQEMIKFRRELVEATDRRPVKRL
jgi:hypothetical protein